MSFMVTRNPYRRPFTPECDAIDARIARLGRGFASMRLAMGEGLMHLETVGGFRRLGFPTLESYAREALGRTGRWASDVRSLAKKLAPLPLLRARIQAGHVSLSLAELVVRVATPHDEAAWVARTATMNVRQMRAELTSRRLEVFDDAAPARVAISVTVDRVEAWAFERARLMVESVGARRGDEAVEAILAEGLGELLARDGEIDLPSSIGGDAAEDDRAWRLELAALHDAAEGAVEAILPSEPVDAGPGVIMAWPDDLVGVDRQLRELAATLARRDVELGRLAESVIEKWIWEALGYVSFDHYCRERIGLSPSSVATRVALVRRLTRLAAVETALLGVRIGYEAAALIARVCGTANEAAWVARAASRTVKLLREELDAVEMLARMVGVAVDLLGPPDEDTMADMHAVERGVIAAVAGQVSGGQVSGGQVSGGQVSGGEVDGAAVAVGTTTMRLSLTAATAQFWKGLERVHAGVAQMSGGGLGESFVGFLVRAVMKSWSGANDGNVAYGDVYLRDRWRCASPVCRSRNVTPHHVTFRSHGGGEERANLVSLCEVCHLELVHGGAMRVRGVAPVGLGWTALGWSA